MSIRSSVHALNCSRGERSGPGIVRARYAVAEVLGERDFSEDARWAGGRAVNSQPPSSYLDSVGEPSQATRSRHYRTAVAVVAHAHQQIAALEVQLDGRCRCIDVASHIGQAFG